MDDTILMQILFIRESGQVNMCDYPAVQKVACLLDMYELVNYIEENPAAYFHFILYGTES